MRRLWHTIADHPIRFFALIALVGLAVYQGLITNRLLDTLVSSDWCAKAIQAERITPGTTFVGLTTCTELLKIQLAAVSTGFHISLGSYAFSMVVIVVIVLAGARASGKLPGGVEFDVSPNAAQAADKVADAAVDKADEIKGAAP